MADDVGPTPPRPGLPPLYLALDERQQSLVALLLAGHTDSSAARRLGVSPRTVTNIVRSLMNRLGVNNRFQLGVALGARIVVAPRVDPPNTRPDRIERWNGGGRAGPISA